MKTKKAMKLFTALLFLLLGLTGTSKILAAPAGKTPVKAGAAPAAPEAAKGGSKKVLRFDSLTITGEAAKPQVFYLLNRKKILVRHEPEKRDLLKSLEQSVEGDPF